MCKCERCGNKIDCGDPVCPKTIPWCFECSKLVVTIPPTTRARTTTEGDFYVGTSHYNLIDNPVTVAGQCLWNILRNHGVGDDILQAAAENIGISVDDYVDQNQLNRLFDAINNQLTTRGSSTSLGYRLDVINYTNGDVVNGRESFTYNTAANLVFNIGLLVDQDGTGHYVEDKNSPVGRVIPSTKKRKKKQQEVKIFSNITLQIIYESEKPVVSESLESRTVGPIIRKVLECIKFFPYKFSINGEAIEGRIESLNELLASCRDGEAISIEVYINDSTMNKSEAEQFLKKHHDELFKSIFGEFITEATSISEKFAGIEKQTEFIEWMLKFRSELYNTMESDEKFLSHIHDRCIRILEEGERHILSNIPTKAKLDDVVKILEIDISESKKEIHSRLVSISKMFDEISDRITKEFNSREKIGRLKRAIDRTKEKRKAGERTRFNVGGTLSDDSDEDEYAKKVQAWIVTTPGEPVLCVKEKGQYWMYLKRKSKILEIQRKTRGEKPLVGDNYPTLGKQLQRLSAEDNKRFLEQLSNLLKSKDSRSKYCTKLDLTNDSLANMYDDLELNPQNAASLVFATLLISEEGPGRLDTGGKTIRGMVANGIQNGWTFWQVLQTLPYFPQFGVRAVHDLMDDKESFPNGWPPGKDSKNKNTYIEARQYAAESFSQWSMSPSSSEGESDPPSLCDKCNKPIAECDCKK